MGDLLAFPRDAADLRIERCDPGPMGTDEGSHELPPNDLVAEDAVIGGLAFSADGLRVALELLAPEHFYSVAHGRAFKAAQEIDRLRTPVDFSTLHGWLCDRKWPAPPGVVSWAKWLEGLADASPTPFHLEAHARRVLELWERRRLIQTCQRVAAECRGDVGEHGAYMAAARADLGKATAPRVRLAGQHVGAVVAASREHINAAIGGRVVGVRYPWRSLEEMLGLLVEGRQTMLGGLSEHGKTTLAAQIAHYVAASPVDALGFGEAVYFMSGEMPSKDFLTRYACSLAGVDVLRLEAGFCQAHELEAVARWFAKLEGLPMVIDDDPAPPSEIASRVRAHKALFEAGRARNHADDLHPRCRMRLVVGDHLQDLATLAKERDEKDRIASTARGWLDDIAKGLGVATLLLSQLLSPSEQAKALKFPPWPTKDDLFGSKKIGHLADTVFAVQRPELLMRGAIPAKWLGVAGLCRLKSRFGGSKRRVVLGFNGGHFSEDLPAAMLQALSNGSDADD